MNILILNWRDIKNPKKGGAELILYELSKRLIKNKHSVTWFSSSFKNAEKEEKLEGINFVRRGNQFMVYIYAFLYYAGLTKKPDIVLDCVNTICWQTPLYVPRKNRILYANQSARRIFFYEYPFPLALICFLLEPLQYLLYKNTKTVCYSNSIKKDLLSFGIAKKLISVFFLGIDHDRYFPGKKSLDPVFIFVARFVKNKRPALCIKAMKRVVKKIPKSKLFLIGYGEEEENLRRQIEHENINQNIFIVNKNNVFFEANIQDMKVKLMQEAWALLLPSVKEGWGMVVTEAAACATPSIVSNVSGLKDSVIHNKTGFILSQNPSIDELSSSMIKIAQETKLRKKLSQNALAFSNKFTWEKSYRAFNKYLF